MADNAESFVEDDPMEELRRMRQKEKNQRTGPLSKAGAGFAIASSLNAPVDSAKLDRSHRDWTSSGQSSDATLDKDNRPSVLSDRKTRTMSMPMMGLRRVESTVRPNASRPNIKSPTGDDNNNMDVQEEVQAAAEAARRLALIQGTTRTLKLAADAEGSSPPPAPGGGRAGISHRSASMPMNQQITGGTPRRKSSTLPGQHRDRRPSLETVSEVRKEDVATTAVAAAAASASAEEGEKKLVPRVQRTSSMPMNMQMRGPRRIESTVRANASRPHIQSPMDRKVPEEKPELPQNHPNNHPNKKSLLLQRDRRSTSLPMRPKRIESTVRPNASHPDIQDPTASSEKPPVYKVDHHPEPPPPAAAEAEEPEDDSRRGRGVFGGRLRPGRQKGKK